MRYARRGELYVVDYIADFGLPQARMQILPTNNAMGAQILPANNAAKMQILPTNNAMEMQILPVKDALSCRSRLFAITNQRL